MTYRKLFFHLLALSTALLAAVWWLSLGSWSIITFSPSLGNTILSCTVYPGTASLIWEESGFADNRLRFNRYPLARVSDGVQDRYGRRGFSLQRTAVERDPGDTRHDYVTSFPLWAPYLIIVGCLFAFTRFLEKRSKGGTEKALAEAEAAEKLTRDPG